MLGTPPVIPAILSPNLLLTASVAPAQVLLVVRSTYLCTAMPLEAELQICLIKQGAQGLFWVCYKAYVSPKPAIPCFMESRVEQRATLMFFLFPFSWLGIA